MRGSIGIAVFFAIVIVVGLGTTAIALIFARAPNPESIEPIPVSQVAYISMSCEQLDAELVILDERLAVLSERQRRNQTRDMLLNLFVKLGSGAIATNEEAAIAQTKGERVAVLRENPRCAEE